MTAKKSAPVPPQLRNPNGAPSKCTREIRQKICDAIRLGTLSEASAAAHAGINPSTLVKWLQKGRRSLALPPEQRHPRDRKYRLLVTQLSRAHVDGRKSLESFVARDASKDGRLALEVLARRFPEDWARRDRQTVEHSGSVQHTHQLTGDAARTLLLAKLAALSGPAIPAPAVITVSALPPAPEPEAKPSGGRASRFS